MEFRNYKRTKFSLDRIENQRVFLQDCKYFGITPKFMRIGNIFLRENFQREIKRFETIVINKLIRKKYAETALLRDSLKRLEAIIDEKFPEIKKEKLDRIGIFAEIEKSKQIERQRKKLRFWIKKNKLNMDTPKQDEIPFLNFSRTKLNAHQEALLKKGPKYIIDDTIDLKDTIPKIECVLEKFPAHEKTIWRSEIQSNIAKKLMEKDRNGEDRRVLADLKKRSDLAFVHTDKTGKIAILDREDYNDKLQNVIEEIQAIKINKDPNKKIIEKVKLIMKEGIWPNDEKPTFLNNAANTPRMFGRLKDHKNPLKIRPIVNKREGPTYELERFMKKVYQDLQPASEHEIHSTNEFMQKIKDINFKKDDLIVSFDVVNLYPSINIEEIEELINKKIKFKYDSIDTKISETLIRCSNLLLRENYFSFNGQFYKQQNGVPMGSPISGIIAGIKMCEFENIIIDRFKDKIKVWMRYVDDVFAVLDGNSNPTEILKEINTMDKSIKFTIEEAKSGNLNYLDVNIMKTGDKIETKVYRKPTASNTIIAARCSTPYQYKMAAIRSYVNRAINICSTEKLLQEELKIIQKISTEAGYNKNIVQKIFKKRMKKLNVIEPGQMAKKIFTRAIPFLKGLSEKIARKARKNNLIIPIKPNLNIFQRVRNEKEKIENLETAGIYKINMNNSAGEKMSYIGVTKRKIKKRIKEHIADIKHGRTGTAIAQKYRQENIQIDFENVKKIARYEDFNYAYKREAVEIICDSASINSMEHAFIDAGWRHMLRGKPMRETGKEEPISAETDLGGNSQEASGDSMRSSSPTDEVNVV